MKPLNIAHRGGAGLMPENTLAAFADAQARGCDGAELDVQLSADGEVVVFHDYRLKPDLCRDGEGQWLSAAGPPVTALTLKDLQRFDVGRARPGSTYAAAHPRVQWQDGARIPTLAQVIETVRVRPFLLFVELKCDSTEPAASAEALAAATLSVLRRADYLAHSILVGFDWRALKAARSLEAGVPCWFTTDAGDVGAETLNKIARSGGAGWFPHFSDATPARVAEARALGLNVGAWTVNDTAEMRRLGTLDALCTDYPDRFAGL